MRLLEPELELAERSEIEALQLRRLTRLLRYCWATNPFYRERWKAAGVDIERIDSIEAFAALVPTVGKPDFVADQSDAPPYGRRHASALEPGTQLVVITTSGTSGQGQEVHLQTAEEWHVSARLYCYMHRWAGLDRGDRFFLAMPVTMLGGGQVEYQGATTYGLTIFPVGNYDAQRKIDLMRRFQPHALLANSSYLGRLATLLDEPRGFQLKALISGGEGSGIEWLRRVGESWGTPVFDRYGSSQVGCDHAFTCDQGIGTPERPGVIHNIDPYVLVEVIDPETGKQVADGDQGELVITSLYHLDTPLVRCRIGDKAIYHDPGYCACGRPFIGLEAGSIGRADDMRKIKGVNVWPAAVDNVVFQYDAISEYQVLLSSSAEGVDESLLRVVPRAQLSEEAWGELSRRLGKELQARIGIRFGVDLLPADSVDLAEIKARRWVDERAHVVANPRTPAHTEA